MFNGKLTKDEKLDKLRKIQQDKRSLETSRDTHDLISAYKNWLRLPYHEKQIRRSEWDKYYLEVKQAPIYALFLAQKVAASKENWGTVKELGLEAKRMREEGQTNTVSMPPYTDPFDFDFNPIVRAYRNCEDLIKELNYIAPDDEEQKQVWGNRGGE